VGPVRMASSKTAAVYRWQLIRTRSLASQPHRDRASCDQLNLMARDDREHSPNESTGQQEVAYRFLSVLRFFRHKLCSRYVS
jgi:hypothetical protein